MAYDVKERRDVALKVDALSALVGSQAGCSEAEAGGQSDNFTHVCANDGPLPPESTCSTGAGAADALRALSCCLAKSFIATAGL